MSVRCPSCHRRCPGGGDRWITCVVCGARFYALEGGEGTEDSPRFDHRERKRRPPPDAAGPALGYASLACAACFPLLAVGVAHVIPESGAPLVTMESVLAIVLGGAFGFGALKLSAIPGRWYGALGLVLATLQAAWLAAALWTGAL